MPTDEPPNNDLSKDDVSRIIYSYKDEGVTDELYAFGKMLLSETDDRAKQIDSKATSVLGWATAILAFLFTQTHTGERDCEPFARSFKRIVRTACRAAGLSGAPSSKGLVVAQRS